MSRIALAQGRFHFESERRQAMRRALTAVLTGRSRQLPRLTEVLRAARIAGELEVGEHEIPVARIRGSESRTGDFDPAFLPRSQHLEERWARLYALIDQGVELPPIDVYQVGDVYFVKDGHHRVSLARHLGWDTIRANVVVIRTRAPVGTRISPEDLLRAAEYASFLEATQLDLSRPQARIDCSKLGRYDVMVEHILGHRWFLGLERGREVPLPEAAASWYDSVYRPLLEAVRVHGLHERLPGWTDADIYLALTRLWLDLDLAGSPAGPEDAVRALLADPDAVAPPAPPRRPRRLPRLRRTRRSRGPGGDRGPGGKSA